MDDRDHTPPPPRPGAPSPPPTATWPRFAGYEVLGVIGEGGMGSVYKARHLRLDRVVALKVIRPDALDGAPAIARFLREARAAARLNHPNIVTVHDAGESEGSPFLAMEYLDGPDLAQVLRQRGPLAAAEACDYVRQAALGLQHAHEQGLVHRDIKPHNLMLTRQGVVKVLDFGLARPTASAAEGSGLTLRGAVLGTPDYLAPEQARDSGRADIRADVYSLGCTLYHLLTGRVPYPQEGVLEKLAGHLSGDPTPAEQLRPGLPPGLGRVLARMMARDPAARYATPGEAARALAPFAQGRSTPRRWGAVAALGGALVALVLGAIALWPWRAPSPSVDDDPPGGEPPVVKKKEAPDVLAGLQRTLLYQDEPRGRDWSRGVEGVRWGEEGGHAFQEIAAGRAGTSHCWEQGFDFVPSDDIELEMRLRVTGATRVTLQFRGTNYGPRKSFVGLVLTPAGPWRFYRRLDDANDRTLREETLAREDGAKSPWLVPGRWHDLRVVARGRGIVVELDGRRVASIVDAWQPPPGWRPMRRSVALWQTAVGAERSRLDRAAFRAWKLTPLPEAPRPPSDKERITADAPAIKSGQPLSPTALVTRPPPLKGALSWALETTAHRGLLHALAFHPDGQTCAAAGEDGAIRLWQAPHWQMVRVLLGHRGAVRALAWSPDGSVVASGGDDGTVRLWQPTTGKLLRVSDEGAAVNGVAWSPEGDRVAAGLARGGVRVRDTARGQERFRVGDAEVHAVAWSSDGLYLAAGMDDTARLWTAAGEPRRQFAGPKGAVRSLAFSPGGKALAASDDQGALFCWETDTGHTLHAQRRAGDVRCSLAWYPDGGSLLAGASGELRVWDIGDLQPSRLTLSSGVPRALALASDGRLAAVADTTGLLRFIDLPQRQVKLMVRACGGPGPAAWSGNGGRVAVAGGGGLVVWNVERGTSGVGIWTFDVRGLALDANGRRLAVGGADGIVRLLDATKGTALGELKGHKAPVALLAWSPDGLRLASIDTGLSMRLWKVKEQTSSVVPLGELAPVSAAWSPVGDRLALGDDRGNAHLLDSQTGKKLSTFAGHRGWVSCAWDEKGATLLTHDATGAIRRWDLATGRAAAPAAGPPGAGQLSPNGAHLVNLHGPSPALWKCAAPERLGTLVALPRGRAVLIAPNGRRRGAKDSALDLVYVVCTAEGQETLRPAAFQAKFGEPGP